MLWVMAMGDNGGWPYFVGEGTVKLERYFPVKFDGHETPGAFGNNVGPDLIFQTPKVVTALYTYFIHSLRHLPAFRFMQTDSATVLCVVAVEIKIPKLSVLAFDREDL